MADAIDFETHEEMKRQLAQVEADGQRMTVEVARLRAALDEIACACERIAHPASPVCLSKTHVDHMNQIAARARRHVDSRRRDLQR